MNGINKKLRVLLSIAFVFFLFFNAKLYADSNLKLEGKLENSIVELNSKDLNAMPTRAHKDCIVSLNSKGKKQSYIAKGIEFSYLLPEFCAVKVREADVLLMNSENKSSKIELYSDLTEKSKYTLVYDIQKMDGNSVKEFQNKGFAIVCNNKFLTHKGEIFYIDRIKINAVLNIQELPKPLPEFTDISKEYEYAENAIYELVRMGIMSGVSENEFAPQKAITKGELAKILAKSLELNEVIYEGNYSDVDKNDPNANYIASAVYEGLLNGYTDGSFGTDNNINRQEFAVLAANIAVKIGKVTESEIEQYHLDENSFDDYDSVFAWVENCIAYINSLGLYDDFITDVFSPLKPSTRAETAYIIYNLIFK